MKEELVFLRASDIIGKKIFESGHFIYDGNKGLTLTHYTNLQGLIGIIGTHGFCLSDMRFLNDSEEYKNGVILSQKRLQEYISKSSKFNKIIQDAILELSLPLKNTYFVASLSEKEDSLEQWRAYSSSRDRIAIIFEHQYSHATQNFSMSTQCYAYAR
jgi:hypothetical protein